MNFYGCMLSWENRIVTQCDYVRGLISLSKGSSLVNGFSIHVIPALHVKLPHLNFQMLLCVVADRIP